MHSPLPDSSALERGILSDPQPSRLSLVQDNVRNLLRNSTLVGSIRSSPPATPTRCHDAGMPPTPPETPTRIPQRHSHRQPEVLPSPTDSLPSTASPASSTASLTRHSPLHDEAQQNEDTGAGLFPPPKYPSTMTRLSALFTGRAVAALNHPDVSDQSLAVLARQKAEKRQRRAWKRKRAASSRGRGNRGESGSGSGKCLLCIVAALMLASVVATYLIVATTSESISTTFHVLFILGIILATIVFAHTLIRLLLFSRSGSFRRGQQILILPTHNKHKHRRRHNHHARRGDSLAVQTVRVMPGLSTDAAEFVPATPIRVQVGSSPDGEVRPDSRDAIPTAIATEEVWDKSPSPIANPPPAYGRWRGSVRANPDLLHWQAIPSPIDDDAQELPSPTYEEAVQRTGPPSYVTRESPERIAGRGDVRGSVLERAQGVEPEMVEVVGSGGEGGGVGVAK